MSKEIDVETILQTLSVVRESIPYELRPLPDDGKASAIATFDDETMQDFELTTVAEALDRLTSELSEALDHARAKALADALRIYYAAEELARDPANAHLVPHVEAMRQAYERDYGRPIPPRQ